MKIAVASENGKVAQHFGHCENFTIFQCDDGKIISTETIANPGHKPGFLPNFLNDINAEVVIAGGMGGGAIQIFNEKNIEVITGAEGDVNAAAESYLKGTLKSTGSVCHDHSFEGSCGN